MNYAITISRTYGSGGKDIGKIVAKKLGIEHFGHRKLSDEVTNDYVDDEAVDYSLILKPDGSVDFEAEDKVFRAQSAAIKRHASENSCVFIGRCADYVLRDYDNIIKIFITADTRDCMRRAMRMFELNPDDAKQLIKTMNKSRSEYYLYHTGQHRDEATNYDLSLNVSGMTPEDAADVIITYVKYKLGI